MMNNNNNNRPPSIPTFISSPSSSLKKPRGGSSSWIYLKCLLFSTISFYLGICIGWNMERNTNEQHEIKVMNTNSSSNNINDDKNNVRILMSNKQKQEQKLEYQKQAILDYRIQIIKLEKKLFKKQEKQQQQQQIPLQQLLPYNQKSFQYKDTGNYVAGYEFLDRNEFIHAFDHDLGGVPMDDSEKHGNNKVMLLYSDHSAFPDDNTSKNTNTTNNIREVQNDNPEDPTQQFLNVNDATKNCNQLHLIFTSTNRNKQCIAILGQYESFHIQKLMRIPKENETLSKLSRNGIENVGPMNTNLPLRIVNRGMRNDGNKGHKVPTQQDTNENWYKNLIPYLTNLEKTLLKLTPIVMNAASITANNNSNNNTVIVMVCNFGQSELLMNFVCNARAKGLDDLLNNIVLFATDIETYDLASNILNIQNIFYDESIFGTIPKEYSESYADETFSKIMFAKIYSVHLVSQLGYNFLFQDVDVLWYKNPLNWFNNETNPYYDRDMYFQDDGSRTLHFAPYSANTGFYFVRNNERTKYFFNSLLMAGDLVISTFSHQTALVALLAEHSSMYGLKVKVWSRDKEEFPGGVHYHQRPTFMKQMINGTVHPYIFHMSWTANKNDKIKYMQQMGVWYLDEERMSTATKTYNGEIDNKGGNDNIIIDQYHHNTPDCCSVKPIVKCHYRDKPSIIPCTDSPLIDRDGISFW